MFIPWIGLGRKQLALPSVEQRKARSCDFQRGRTPFQNVEISFAKKNIFIKRPNLTSAIGLGQKVPFLIDCCAYLSTKRSQDVAIR